MDSNTGESQKKVKLLFCLVRNEFVEQFQSAFKKMKVGFKNGPRQLMLSSDFGEFHIMQELNVNLYR